METERLQAMAFIVFGIIAGSQPVKFLILEHANYSFYVLLLPGILAVIFNGIAVLAAWELWKIKND